MKKLFNKKIYLIIGMFIFVFMGLFFSINKKVEASGEFYYLKNENPGNIVLTPSFKVSFDNQEECIKSLNDATSNHFRTISYCDPASSDSVVGLTPDQNDSTLSSSDSLNYKLLAPITIGGNKILEIETNDIGKYFNILFNIAIALAGGLAVVMLVLGGIQWMGSESVFGKTEGKERIMSAILGLLIALGSYTLLNTINPQLLGKKGLNIDQVSINGEIPILSDINTPIPTGSNNSFPPECPNGVNRVDIGNRFFIACIGDISINLKNMITASKKAKINLSGGGFRTKEDQIKARRNNKCPDVYNSKPTDCKPPTAKPGTSMHEKGVAFDFTCDGKLINPFEKNGIYEKDPSTEKCFVWLKNNASKYNKGGKALKNLKSEPWHWSINGK